MSERCKYEQIHAPEPCAQCERDAARAEVERLRERLWQFESYGFPNVASVLDVKAENDRLRSAVERVTRYAEDQEAIRVGIEEERNGLRAALLAAADALLGIYRCTNEGHTFDNAREAYEAAIAAAAQRAQERAAAPPVTGQAPAGQSVADLASEPSREGVSSNAPARGADGPEPPPAAQDPAPPAGAARESFEAIPTIHMLGVACDSRGPVYAQSSAIRDVTCKLCLRRYGAAETGAERPGRA